jgi:hypothetical protein
VGRSGVPVYALYPPALRSGLPALLLQILTESLCSPNSRRFRPARHAKAGQ